MNHEEERTATVTRLDTADALGQLIARAGRRPAPPAAIESSVRDAVYAAWREETVKRRRTRRVALAAAAAVAAVAAALSWQLTQRAEPPVRAEVATLDEARGNVSLKAPDGTLRAVSIAGTTIHAEDGLWTDATGGARLRIGDAFEVRVAPSSRLSWSAPERLRLESGAVFIDSDGTNRDLTIETPLGEVTHLGTRYQVQVAPDTTTVLVRDGRVRLSTRTSMVTAAGREQLVLTSGGRIDRSKVDAHGSAWRWVDSLAESIEIDGVALSRFLEWAARETGRELDFVDARAADAAASTVLHGSVAGMAPDDALRAVLSTTDFSAEFADGRLVVASPTR